MSEETEAAAHHLPAADRTANRVADVFLGQYYEVLKNHPELAHKFYVDSSVVSRPGADGSMSSVTTLKGIDDLLQSFYAESESDVEVCTADAQYSYGDGLVILVTGFIRSEELKKRFSQMFFLAPQERGYYVLNDVFRYSGEDVRRHAVVENDAAAGEAESTIAVEAVAENGKNDPESAGVDRKVITEPKTISGASVAAIKSTDAKGQSNGKLSYASMVKVAASSGPVTPSSPAALPSGGSIVKESSNADNIKKPSLSISDADKKISPPSKAFDQAVEDRSVSVWELPLSIKPYQLDRIFSRKFGPVKQGGIQIRSSQGKNGPLCYAFLEFESAISADTAIKASPVSIDGRPVGVKRRTSKGKTDARPRAGSPHRDSRSADNNSNSRAPGRPFNLRNISRQREASHNIDNAGHRDENGHAIYQDDKAGTPAKPEPEIDDDGFQTVSRNIKWKTQGN